MYWRKYVHFVRSNGFGGLSLPRNICSVIRWTDRPADYRRRISNNTTTTKIINHITLSIALILRESNAHDNENFIFITVHSLAL